MSDRDKVRELAEEIAESELHHTDEPENHFLDESEEEFKERCARHWDSRLRAFLDEREEGWRKEVLGLERMVEMLSVKRDRALGEGAGLRGALASMVRDTRWWDEDTSGLRYCMNCGQTAPKGRSESAIKHHEGCSFIEADSALAPSPLSKLAGEVLRESLRHITANRLCEKGGFEDSEYDLDDVSGVRFRAAVDALRAELDREGGEGG